MADLPAPEKNYPSWLFAVVKAVIVGLRLENKFLYLDTRDSMELCAVKRR